MRASFVMSEVRIGLRRNMTMTFAVIITVAISLTLLGVGFLANSQVRVMKDYWYDKIEVSVFLCGSLSESPSCSGGPITATARNAIENDLQSLPVVRASLVVASSQRSRRRTSCRRTSSRYRVPRSRRRDVPWRSPPRRWHGSGPPNCWRSA